MVGNEHIQEVGIRFTTENGVEFQRTVKEINAEMDQATAEYKKASAEMNENATATEKLTNKAKLYEAQISSQKDKVATLRTELDVLTSAEEKDEAAIAKKKKELTNAEAALANYEKTLKSTNDELKKHTEWTDKASKALKDTGEKMESAGKKIAPFSAGAVGALTLMGKSAIDFESAFTGVVKTTDTAGMSAQEAAVFFDELAQGMIDLSERTTTSASDIARVGEAAGQLGIQKENVLEFTEVMVMLGDTTNLSAEEAASSLAKLTNITGMQPEFYSNLGSSIVALGNNFAATENDIVATATRLASTGELAGLTEPQILALATALVSVGIDAEAGGTAASKMLKELQLAVEKGGDSLDQFANVAGISANDFKAAYEQDALGALTLFIAGLNDTERTGQSAILTLDDMGLTEARLSNAILSLANNSDLLTNAVNLSNEAWTQNDALAQEAELRYATTESQMVMLGNQFNNFAMQLGELLLPMIQSVIEWVSGIVTWLQSLDEGTQKVILVVLGVIAAIGPLLITLGKVSTGLGSIIGIIPTVVSGFSSLFAIIAANPVILVITAIIAIIAVLWTKCEWFRDAVKAVVNAIIDIFKSWIEYIKSVFVGAWTAATESIANVFTSLFNSLKAIWENIKGIFNGIVDFIKSVFTGNWRGAWEAVKDVFANVFGALGNLVKAPINAVISVINGAIAGINKISITVPDWVPGLGGKNFGFNIPTLPLLAKGGQLLEGMAIVAEAGPELIQQRGGRTIVTPLSAASRNNPLSNVDLSQESIAQLARAIAEAMRGGENSGGQPLVIRLVVDGRTIVEAFLEDILTALGKRQIDILTARG